MVIGEYAEVLPEMAETAGVSRNSRTLHRTTCNSRCGWSPSTASCLDENLNANSVGKPTSTSAIPFKALCAWKNWSETCLLTPKLRTLPLNRAQSLTQIKPWTKLLPAGDAIGIVDGIPHWSVAPDVENRVEILRLHVCYLARFGQRFLRRQVLLKRVIAGV